MSILHLILAGALSQAAYTHTHPMGWRDFDVANPPSLHDLNSNNGKRMEIGRGAQAVVVAYSYDGESTDLVMKPCRKQVVQQRDQDSLQEWEIGRRLSSVRRHIPICAPILTWWKPRAPGYAEGLCMPRVDGPSLWQLYASPLFNKTPAFYAPRDRASLLHTTTWASNLLCLLWGLHQLQVHLNFSHNDLSMTNVLLKPLPSLKRGARVRLEFGPDDMVYEIPLPYHPSVGVFWPQIIDPSQGSCKCERTGFQVGFTASRDATLDDEHFKWAVGYTGGFHSMSDIGILFRELVDIFCYAWSHMKAQPSSALMKVLLDGANLGYFALGLPEKTVHEARSPNDILQALADKFKAGRRWLAFHCREINPDHHPWMRTILKSTHPKNFYTRIAKTHLTARFSESPLQLVRTHTRKGRLWDEYQVLDVKKKTTCEVILEAPRSLDLEEDLRAFMRADKLQTRLSESFSPSIDGL